VNPSRRQRRTLWQWVVTALSIVVLPLAREVIVDLVSEVVGGGLGSVFGNAVVAVALVAVLLPLAWGWWARRHPRPASPTPPEDEPDAGAVEDLPQVPGFVGRERALAFATRPRDGAVAVVGRRGVGTSACVKQAALLLRDGVGGAGADAGVEQRLDGAGEGAGGGEGTPPGGAGPFPDGAFYLNLREGTDPLPAEQVVAVLARWFGTPVPRPGRGSELRQCAARLRERLAERVEERDPAGHERTVVRERRTLLVLDNVDEPSQVELLLPFPRQCRVLLAGCPELARQEGIDACWPLDEPGPGEAASMFVSAAQAAGDQAGRLDPRRDGSLRKLIELCGRMPRPVRALGYHMALHGWPADELLDALRRLLAAPAHREVRYIEALDLVADQDVAYTSLRPGTRRLYRRLSLAPGPLEPDAVATLVRPPVLTALAALPWPRRLAQRARDRAVTRVRRMLGELATAGFVEAPRGTYRICDPSVAYAQLHLRRDELPGGRRGAELRLTRHLARKAERYAARLATMGSIETPLARDGDHRDPCSWFELHHRTLRRLVTRAAGRPGIPPRVQPRRLRYWWFRVAVAVSTWYAAVGATRDWEWTCTKVLATPTAGDRWRMTSWARNELGVIHRRRGDPARAHDLLAYALRDRGNWGESQVLTNIGLAQLDRAQPAVEDATWHLRVAAAHRSPRDRAGRARTNVGLGLAHLAGGDLRRARDHLWRAVQGFDRLDDVRNAAAARCDLGLVYWEMGERQEAWETLERAVHDYWRLKQTACDRLIDRDGEAAALLNLGGALVTTAWTLAGVDQRRGTSRPQHASRAYALLEQGLALRPPGATPGRGRTLLYEGDAALLLGRRRAAQELWREAGETCRDAGDPAGTRAAAQRLYVAWLSGDRVPVPASVR
jgi:tetratricopeptide (TPR) repeat protein